MGFGQSGYKFTVLPEKPAPPIPQNLAVLDTIGDIATFNDATKDAILVKEQTRGGTFLKYTGAQAVDNGIIFQDAAGVIWKRVIESNYINIQWYGAISVTAKQFDSYFAFVGAYLASLNVENVQAPNIYIPGTVSRYKILYKYFDRHRRPC